jgi:hypothetical protein
MMCVLADASRRVEARSGAAASTGQLTDVPRLKKGFKRRALDS